MNEDSTTKQIEYLMSLFGIVRKEGGNHPVLNNDHNQVDLYTQNMIQLLEFCNSSRVNDNEIIGYFSGSNIPVVFSQ